MVVIVGTGNMAQNLIRGLVKKRDDIVVVGRNPQKRAELAQHYGIQSADLDGYDIEQKEIIIAIKPHAVQSLSKKLRGTAAAIYSLAAALPLARLRESLKSEHYVRAMPNIAASKGASMTALCGDEGARERAVELFGAIGKTLWLESESKLDAATAIAGCGPAFLAPVAEALADGGVTCGLTAQEAKELVRGLFEGFAALLDDHPALIKERVMSPAGVTAAGYIAIERGAVRHAFMEALALAYQKTKKEES